MDKDYPLPAEHLRNSLFSVLLFFAILCFVNYIDDRLIFFGSL